MQYDKPSRWQAFSSLRKMEVGPEYACAIQFTCTKLSAEFFATFLRMLLSLPQDRDLACNPILDELSDNQSDTRRLYRTQPA
jgi:hypothetical protein